jgi:hypothetical protein
MILRAILALAFLSAACVLSPATAKAEALSLRGGTVWTTREECTTGRQAQWCVYVDCENASRERGKACENIDADGYWTYLPPPCCGAPERDRK